jgi:hemerythrin
MSIEWKDSYKIGDDDIDAEHQEIFRLAANVVAASTPAEQTSRVIRLYKFARGHFKHEERHMFELSYPDADVHIEQHRDLVARLNGIAADIASGTLNKADLEAFISYWLLVHIATFDTKLTAYGQYHYHIPHQL